jgi:hypothetical protein
MNNIKTKSNIRVVLKTIVWFSMLGFVVSTMAYMEISFPGWDVLIGESSDIIIAKCKVTPDPYKLDQHGHSVDFKGLINSNIEIVSILKGVTNSVTGDFRAARLLSTYWPRQGEYYLIFQLLTMEIIRPLNPIGSFHSVLDLMSVVYPVKRSTSRFTGCCNAVLTT